MKTVITTISRNGAGIAGRFILFGYNTYTRAILKRRGAPVEKQIAHSRDILLIKNGNCTGSFSVRYPVYSN